jgi:endonuclease YncB( thermonuclease family)
MQNPFRYINSSPEMIRLFGIDAPESGHAAVSRPRWKSRTSRPVGAG